MANPPRRAQKAKEPIWPVAALITGVATLALVVGVLIGSPVVLGNAAGPAASTGEPTRPPATPLVEWSMPPTTSPATPVQSATSDPAPEKSGGLPPVEAPRGRGMLHLPPVQVDIPAIGVSSSLVELGLNPDSSLQVPEDAAKPGWYAKGSYPGDVGAPPALIVGHVDDKDGPAVFHALKELQIGDEIRVTRTDGSVAVFAVYDAQQYPKSALPTEEIYRKRDDSELVLITCTGNWDTQQRSYLDNYVVSARLDPKLSGQEA